MNLKESYNRDNFVEFLNSFLPKYSQDIRRVESKGIKVTKNAYYLGESPDLDLSIFELTHTSPRDARVALANDGFNIMKNSASYRALVVYNADKGDEWRLSLMTASHDVDEKGRPIQKWSNPRRLSFFLGPEAKIRTPHNFLKNKGPVKDFVDLLSRFDVEVVTKEFFNNYRKLYEDMKGYLEKDHAFKNFASKNDVDLDTFAKKLLGQIVFCYFLQRKGWLGASKGKPINEGDKNFMRSMFDRFKSEKKNYFNDCLEYLFYASLNRPSDAAASFYRAHFQCQIPFLNGGLFEPLDGYDWRKEFLYIPDKIFSNSDKTGILDIFDLYNFTVYEDNPMDREVAVDPEMLGKVFENLLPENLRKGKGTYYTPREIVHYMCRESLINHLASESKLNEDKIRDYIVKHDITLNNNEKDILDGLLSSIKICDPACGSGAFLVGMLNEIVSARRKLNPHTSEHQLKKEAIENCIYGVDIDFGAVEIAKLRLWLSLVVDYELEEIEPLPNLDYKIMCGNSLLEELVIGEESISLFDAKLLDKNKPKRKMSDKVMQMDLFNQDSDKYFKILRKLHVEYFHETNPDIKKTLRTRIDKIELDFIKASINTKIEEVETQIKNLNMQKPEDKKRQTILMKKKLEYLAIPNEIHRLKVRPYFLWQLNFYEVFQENGGFDVVISNPPYGANIDKLVSVYKRIYPIVIKNYADIYKIFFEKGLKLCKDGGVETFIVPNTFLSQPRYKDMRGFLLNYDISKIVNLGEKVFEDVVVPVCISMIRNKASCDYYMFCDLSFESKFSGGLNRVSFAKVMYRDIKKFKDLSLLQKYSLKEGELYFDDVLEIKDAGIQYHRSGIGLKNKGGNDLYERLFSNNPNKFSESISVWYGKLIDDYYISPITDEYFNVNYKEILKSNESVSFSREAFKRKNKILWRQTASNLKAVLDIKGISFRNTIQCCWLKETFEGILDIKYVLAVINSSYIKYLYNQLVNESGRVFPQVKITHVKKLPMKKATKIQQESLAKIVDNIFEVTSSKGYAKDESKRREVIKLQGQIDKIIYKIYGLTEEEIEIVENTTK